MGLSAIRMFCHSQPDIHFPELTTQQDHPPTITEDREECPQEQEFIAIAAHAHTNAILLPLMSLTHQPSPYCLSLPPRSPRTAPVPPPATSCWRRLFIDHAILSQTVQFLEHKDLLILSQCSQTLKTFTTLHLLQNPDNWSLTMSILQPYIQGPSHLKEEKEHSES